MTNLIESLKNIENSGNFATSGKFKSILPGMCIDGIGDVSFPFITEQAEKIITKCEQAPFGRGEETIIDTSVRNVFQMSPKHVSFTNPEWDDELKEVCWKIGKDLGLSDCNIKCELYKVLIYGPGSFFKPHRDTEKMPNMFATMVVNLPSTHVGGELVVSHDNNTTLVEQLINELNRVCSDNFLSSIFTPAIMDTMESYIKEKDHDIILKKIASSYIKLVEKHYPSPPKEPKTYARTGNIKCKCTFCKDVNDFLPKEDLREILFEKTLKRNLLHIEDQIYQNHLDLDMLIDKIGNKFYGTVVKNKKSFEKEMEKFATSTRGREKILSKIESIEVRSIPKQQKEIK